MRGCTLWFLDSMPGLHHHHQTGSWLDDARVVTCYDTGRVMRWGGGRHKWIIMVIWFTRQRHTHSWLTLGWHHDGQSRIPHTWGSRNNRHGPALSVGANINFMHQSQGTTQTQKFYRCFRFWWWNSGYSRETPSHDQILSLWPWIFVWWIIRKLFFVRDDYVVHCLKTLQKIFEAGFKLFSTRISTLFSKVWLAEKGLKIQI